MRSLSRFRRVPQKGFRDDRSGNVAMLFGLALLPVFGFLGAAVDYGRSIAVRSSLQAAADMTVLQLATDPTIRTDAQLQLAGEAALRAAFGSRDAESLGPITVTQTPTEIRVAAAATVRTKLAGLIGTGSMQVGTATAANKRSGLKTNLLLLLDNSASMGLAATEAGRDRLRALVGCAFACHTPEGSQTKSNLQVAIENGIQTRVDVLRSAVTGLVDKLDRDKGPTDELRVGTLSFDDAPRIQMPLTTNLAAVRSYLAGFSLGGNTSFSSAMPLFNRQFDVQGDGHTRPREFALIVTDGVQGRRDRVGGFHPFDSRLCDTLKSAAMGNITVIVLNTRYVPMPTEQPYRETVMPIQSQLEPALQACATPGYYFAATDQAEINRAFDDIFAALKRLRLTS